MAVKAKKVKMIDKWRKKRYFSILAPKIFQERELGNAMAYESASLKGRAIETNLMVLTGNVKKQDINITFKVEAVKGDTAFTFIDKYEVSPAAIKRKVRRGRDRLDESFQCVTRDNRIVRIKPLVITAVKTSRSVKSALRKETIQFMINCIRRVDYDTLILDILNEKLQRETANRLRKIFPIRFVDIRVLRYLGEQKSAMGAAPAEAMAEEQPAAEKPTEAADVGQPEEDDAEEPNPKKRASKRKEDVPAEGDEAEGEESLSESSSD
ncbi:hypothetical protein JW898_00410 [Candidatus Woesearchaeota archaeon]|nr:hypothetical protein [Candidatus Woesearchaeota archaeon]